VRGATIAPKVAPRWRLWAVAAVLGVGLVVLLAKAGHLQLVLGDDLRELAEKQYVRKLKVSAPRGNIYDRHGRPLAVTVPAYSVAAEPRRIEDGAAVARALAPLLELDEQKLAARLSTKRGFAWLKRRVDPSVADAVRAMDLRGISLRKESRRYYPARELAGQVLGLVSIDGDGLDGVERAFDEHLRGRAVTLPGLRDNRGRRLMLSDGVDLEVLAGNDVYLTLDARLQHVAERALLDAVGRWNAKGAWAVVLEPQTGRVLALANVPLFNPNDPGEGASGARRNRAISDAPEPGSVFKIVSFAAALDVGGLKPEDNVFCEDGRIKIGRYVIRDTHPAGWLTAREVFSHSSNIGTIKITQRTGEQKFRDTISRFGIGEAPGLGLVGETRGRVPKQGRWGDVRTATVSYGHGVMVSALQMASVVATVANGGTRVQPRLLERVSSPAGDAVVLGETPPGVRVISEETSRVLTDIMSGVVREGGTGQRANIRGIDVAGKTGTAEKVDPTTGRYSRELHVSSFVGFAPATDPKVVAVVVVDEPQGRVYGGSTAGPAWRAIVEAALVDSGVLTEAEAPTVAGTPVAAVTPAATGPAAAPILEDVVASASSPSVEGAAARFVGLTARQAVVLAEQSGVEVRLLGTGRVVEQTPAPGEPVVEAIELQLSEGT
jgi:cell division protein FtsI (penicillin-binding protein 3)